MKQFTCRVDTLSEGYEQIARVLSEQGWEEHKTLLHIIESGFSKEEMQVFLTEIRRRFSGLTKAGISIGGLVDDEEAMKIIRFTFGGALDEKEGQSLSGIRLSFLYSEEATFYVKQIPLDMQNADEVVQTIRGWMEEMPNLRAIELFPCLTVGDLSGVLNGITKDHEDICVFGALASMRVIKQRRDMAEFRKMMFCMGEDVFQDGITLVFYAGAKLCVHAEMLFGWHPVGRAHTVKLEENSSVGDCCVSAIDNMPPEEFYKKYIGAEFNSFFIENVCEFPMVVEREGIYLGRIPCSYDDEGRLYYYGSIQPGEKVRLSYGNKRELLEQTMESSDRMKEFDAQAVFISACGNRINFLVEAAMQELRFFQEDAPNTLIYHGGAEIYRWHGEGSVLNSTMIVVGMRECASEEELCRIAIPKKHRVCKKKERGVIPLDERLSLLLSTITQELVEAVVEANKANMAKSKFLSSMSHEIRTPINAVLGMDEMILRESEEPQIRKYAQDIRLAGNNLLGIVNDILDFSKIEAGKMEVVPVEYELASVLNDLINLVQKRATDKGLRFVVECEDTTPHLLIGDEIRIKQVVTNILTNAVKYTKEGSITLKVGYHEADENHIFLDVAVKDTGIGMKKSEMGKLFTAFERLDMKQNRTVEGTGLGMSITTGLLHLMGSELSVESVYQKGSEFSFSVKQQVLKWEPIGNFEEAMRKTMEGHERYQESFRAPEGKILVVDDTPMNLTVVQGLLKQTQLQVDTAQSGMECLKKCRETIYDIIFLDHRMPKMDGLETLKKLQMDDANKNRETPVIALTANAISGARTMYFEAGFQDYISKPIDSAKLEAMIVHYLPEEKVTLIEKQDKNLLEEELQKLPEGILAIEALLPEEGVKNCGDAKGYIEALRIFASSMESGLRDIKEFFATSNWRDYTTKVHALKSSARIIGAKRLSELALMLETAGNNQDYTNIVDNTEHLVKQYQKLGEQIGACFTIKEQGARPVIDLDQLFDAYSGIQEFAQGYDYDSIQFIMNSLAEYCIPEEEQGRFEKVKHAVQLADWDALKQIL
ncbi:Signal transduction histidine kinase [Lachnospiraceae bacterium XBB1006]|nr:Signal transduction histidine kinase [Lachnospiraceae bacterium XBB1006]